VQVLQTAFSVPAGSGQSATWCPALMKAGQWPFCSTSCIKHWGIGG